VYNGNTAAKEAEAGVTANPDNSFTRTMRAALNAVEGILA
jgi:hypothetical protein